MAFQEIPWKRFGTPAASRSQVSFRTPYLANEIVALAYQIPKQLRVSPLLALELVRNSQPALSDIYTDMGQMGRGGRLATLSRRTFSKVVCKLDYLFSQGLPHRLSPLDPILKGVASGLKIFGLHKYLFYRSWFRKELAEYVNGILLDSRIQRSPLWNSDRLRQMAVEHISGRKNYVLEIDAVLTLEAVERVLFHDLHCEPKPIATFAISTPIRVAPPAPHPPIKNQAEH
jgi:asparagine synthase (glutamine-hydrolysing)